MSGVSPRVGGGIVAVAGVLLTAFHLHNATRFPDGPVVSALKLMPTGLSLAMVAVGATMARERLVRRRFVGRALAWGAVGTAALSAFGGWAFTDMAGKGIPMANTLAPTLNFATFGALVGLLVGVYDARSIGQQRRSEQVNRINDTLRIGHGIRTQHRPERRRGPRLGGARRRERDRRCALRVLRRRRRRLRPRGRVGRLSGHSVA